MRFLTVSLPFVALAMVVPASVSAQTSMDSRVGRLEQEMRAVQRKVFPEGAGRNLPADPASVPVQEAGGTPASSPVADLDARVSAIETQLKTLTGQAEQNNHKLRQLEDAFAKFKADAAASTAAVAPVDAPAKTSATAKPAAGAVKLPVLSTKPVVATGKMASAAPNAAADERKLAVAAIEKPDSGNAADDAYSYGFRLWQAKFYPEAQAQLKTTVEKYPSAGVASRAQNLLGRAYLDDDKPALASVAFYDNYKKHPQGDRAAESLTYLGESLIRLKKLPDACKVYQELDDVYGATMSASLKDMATKGKARAKCGE
jgi:TolA-binding protein